MMGGTIFWIGVTMKQILRYKYILSFIAVFILSSCEEEGKPKASGRTVKPVVDNDETDSEEPAEEGPVTIGEKKDNTNVDCLWPADHQWVEVKFTVDFENSIENCLALDFSSSDPESGGSADDVGPDHEFVSRLAVKLRAEKLEASRSREYLIGIHCQMDGAEETIITKTVKVPVDATAALTDGTCSKLNY